MKNAFKFLSFLTLGALLLGCAPKVAPTPTPTPNPLFVSIAEKFVDDMVAGNTKAAYATFDAVMQKAVNEDGLKQIGQQLVMQFGPFQKRLNSTSVVEDGWASVIVGIRFENGEVGFKITFDPDGKVAGLHTVPLESGGATPTTVAYVNPSYVDPNSFTETEVTVGTGQWALPGTLTLPKGNGPFPAVVLVHGSGPNDRDETILSNKPFKDIAWGLASQGIAVLRYDKRTLAHSNLFTPEVLKSLTLQEETIDDALLAVKLLRTKKEIDPQKIYVLGHSLGAIAAPRIGEQDPSIAGLIIMAAPTRPLEDIYTEQLKYIFGLQASLSDTEKSYLANEEKKATLVKSPDLSVDTPGNELPMGISGAYWLDIRNYNPATTAATLTIRLLVLQGGRDYQVTPDNLDGWNAALSGKANATIKLYPDLTHLFISGSGKPTPEEYSIPGHVAEEVIIDIAHFISGK